MKYNERFQPPYSSERQPVFRTGLVTEVHTSSFTANVKLDGLESLREVPILGIYGSTFGNDLVWLHDLRGALVVLVHINSAYYILSTVPQQWKTTRPAPQVNTSPAFDLEETVRETKSERDGRNFNPNRPKDLMSGDKVLRASDGAEVGVFRGGIARLKASAAAQFVLCKYRDLARLVARRVKIFTDFGEIEFFHRESGKVGLEIRGGGSLTDETHPDKEKWTALVTLGHREESPDDRVFIETRDSKGQTQTFVRLKMTGAMELWAADNITISSKGNVFVNSDGDTFVKSGGNVSVEAANRVDIKSGQINLN